MNCIADLIFSKSWVLWFGFKSNGMYYSHTEILTISPPPYSFKT